MFPVSAKTVLLRFRTLTRTSGLTFVFFFFFFVVYWWLANSDLVLSSVTLFPAFILIAASSVISS